MKEIWKDVVGYEGYYQVSNLGRVKSLDRIINAGNGVKKMKGRILVPKKSKVGYLRVNLSVKQKVRTIQIHRLVMEAFVTNPKNKKTINHKDGNKEDNTIMNLEWATVSENITHAFRVLGKRNHTTRKVHQYNLDGTFIKTWDSIKEAYESLGLGKRTISNYLMGKVSNPKKFRWKDAN